MAAGREVRAGKAYVEIALRDRVQAGLARVSARLRGFASGVGALGRPLLALGAGLGAPLAFATKVFAGFDDQMRTVKAVTEATDEQFQRLRTTAQELGRTTSFTSAQVASLMTELGRAGFSPDQIDRMTASVLDLSRATSTDATAASGIMAAAIRQFSLEAGDASRVADALTVAANKSFNTLESLGDSLTYAGPVASDFNMSIEDTLALLGALGNVGIQGSNAGTALRRLLTISGAQAERLRDIFGVSFVDMQGNARPLVDVLDEVNQATANLGTAARAQKFNEAFGLLGITGASALSKNAVNVRELRDALASANGVAARTHKEMESGLGGTFRRILSAAEGVAIAIGDALAPALQRLEPLVTTLLGSITQWISANRRWVIGAVLAAAVMTAVGGSLVAVGAMASALAWALGGLGMIWAGLALTASTTGRTLLAPFSGALRVVSTLRAGLLRLALPLKGLPGLVKITGAAFVSLGNTAVSAAARAAVAIRSVASGIVRQLSGLTVQVVRRTVAATASSLPYLLGAGRAALARLGQYARALAPMITGAVNAGFARIAIAAAPAIARLNAAWTSFTQRMSTSWQTVSSRATTAWQAMSSRVGGIWQQLQQRASASAGRVASAWSSVTASVQSRWQQTSSRVTGPFNAAMSRVQQIGRQAVARVSAAWLRLPTWVRGPLAQVAGMAQQDFGRIVTAAMGAVQRIRAAWITLGPALGRSLRTSMISAFATVRSVGLATFARLRAAGTGMLGRIGAGARGAGGRMAGAVGSLGSLAGVLGASIGGPLAPLLMAAPLVLTALGAVGTALAAIVSPVGLVVAAVSGAVYAWTRFSESGRAGLNIVGQALGELWAIVREVVGGISAALAAGDVRLAARILWSGLKVVFFQGAEQVRQVWPSIAAAANHVWSYIRQGASRLMGWLQGIWARVPSFISGPLSTVGTALGSLGTYLGAMVGDLFGQLGGIFRTVFGGLTKAISEGDWEAAGQIVMGGLEAAWLTGVAKLSEIWNGLKAAMIEAFAGVVIAVHRMWSGMVQSLANSLLDLAAQDGAAGAVARKLIGVDMRAEDARSQQLERERREVVQRNLEWTIGQWEDKLQIATETGDAAEVEQLTAQIAQARRELGALSGPLGTATEDAKRIVQDATRDAQGAVGAYWGGVASDARQNADAAIEDARGAAEDARQRLEQTAGLPETPAADGKSALQKAREELDAALAEAKQKRELFDSETAQQKVDQAGGGLGDLPGVGRGIGAGEIQGTFNAMAIRGLGASSLAERTAKASEQIAQNTKQLVKEAQDGGLAFS